MFIWTIRTILVVGVFLTLTCKFQSKSRFFWKKSLLQVITKMNLFCGGKFWKVLWGLLKSPSMLGSLPQGLFFLEKWHSWNFKICPFWKKCDFAQIWWKNRHRYSKRLWRSSQEGLRSLSGYSQETPWGNLCLQGIRSALQAMNWCHSAAKCKYLKKGTDSPQSGEGDMHQVL